jgi:hypothetical protein
MDITIYRNNTPNEIICREYTSLSVPAIPIQMSVTNQLDETLNKEFILKKTDISDVFEVYNILNKEKIYLNIKKDNKVGICAIPNIKTSHYCKMMGDKYEIFINDCTYNTKFKKWMPLINDTEFTDK